MCGCGWAVRGDRHDAALAGAAAAAGGVRHFAVARAREALELRARRAVPRDAALLLLGHAPPAALGECVAHGVSLAAWSARQIGDMARAARRVGVPARVHAKVNSGMTRVSAVGRAGGAGSRRAR